MGRRGDHYVRTGLQDYEVYGHQPFDWDGYYVEPDLMEKPFYYGDGDHYEAKYRIYYLETE